MSAPTIPTGPTPTPEQPCTRVPEILRQLGELKVELSVEDGRLRFCPRDAVPADLLDLMRANRADLIVAIRRRIATERLITEQLAQLVPFQTPDGKRGWVHPAYREILEQLGM
jgi:TubC N-terminal docking domain